MTRSHQARNTTDLSQHFIGPKAENMSILQEAISLVLTSHQQFRSNAYPDDPSLLSSSTTMSNNEFKTILLEFLKRSETDRPFFHPRYVAQMLKDPCIPAIVAYFNHLLTNPNNHAYEGGPVTTGFESDVIDLFLNYFNFSNGWGHLCSGGTIANLEALWVIRENRGHGKVLLSAGAHFAWRRICELLCLEYLEVPVDVNFRLDIELLEKYLAQEDVMAVIANLGATGTGSVDDLEQIVALRDKFNFHLHTDAAYGGFARSIILDQNNAVLSYKDNLPITPYLYRQLCALEKVDSITIDPHKHGLMPYGAGAIFYRDKNLQSVILNEAPYTYNNKDQLNLGRLSLEGSRPGAMASACYLTYTIFPLHKEGMGRILFSTLKTAKYFYQLLENSTFNNVYYPDLDICCLYPKYTKAVEFVSELNQITLKLYENFSIDSINPAFILSKYELPEKMTQNVVKNQTLIQDENLIVLRCILFKHWLEMNNEFYLRELVKSLETAHKEVQNGICPIHQT